MSDKSIPWLTKWDDKMVNILSPIAAADTPPKLHMLFFANTFPLAYHYAIALKKAEQPPQELIVSSAWGAPKEDNMILYTNDRNDRSESTALVPVTIFKPRYAFVPLTLASSRMWEDPKSGKRIKGKTLTLSDFLRKVTCGEYKFDNIIIYAEIVDLGDYLKDIIRNLIKKEYGDPTVFAVQGSSESVFLPVHELFNPRPSILRVFIYGGSLSSYLRRKEDRYLPLDIDNGNGDDGEKMETYVRCPPEYIEPLKQYHEELYKAAGEAQQNDEDSETCPPFFTVYRSYNEMAWLLQHRSSFKNAKEYARCLWEHHDGRPKSANPDDR